MWENLPPDVLSGILCRLPPKSLLRCRSVCKSWRSLIADPCFISLHRRHSPSFLLLHFYEHYYDHPPSFLRLGEQFLSLSDYSLPLPSLSDSIRFIHHCHGLLCLVTKSSSFIICNPSLRRFLSLPRPLPIPKPRRHHNDTHAFGFDSRNHDYKIVRIVLSNDINHKMFRISYARVEVYSLASGFWRTLPLHPVVAPSLTILGSYGFVNGLVHWGARRRVKEGDHERFFFFVLSFNFVDEVFHEVTLPESFTTDSSFTVVRGYNEKALTVYRLSCDVNGEFSCSIWEMKEYGVVQSWNKIFYFDLTRSGLKAPSLGVTIPDIYFPPDITCIASSGEMLLRLKSHGEQPDVNLFLLDVESKRFVNLQFGAKDYFWWSLSVLYYTESLVLPDNDRDLMSY